MAYAYVDESSVRTGPFQELVDKGGGWYQLKRADGTLLTLDDNESHPPRWEAPSTIAPQFQQFTISGNIAAFWPRGEPDTLCRTIHIVVRP